MPEQTWTSGSDFDDGTYSQTQSESGDLLLERDYPNSYDVTLKHQHKVSSGNSYTSSHIRDLEAQGSIYDTSEYSTENTSFNQVNSITYDIANTGWSLSAASENAAEGGPSDHESTARVVDSEGNVLYSHPQGDDDGSTVTKDWGYGSGGQSYDYLFDFFGSGSWTSETRTWSQTVEIAGLEVDSSLADGSITVTVEDDNGLTVSKTLSGGTESFDLAGAFDKTDAVTVSVDIDNGSDLSTSPELHYVTVTGDAWPATPSNHRVTSHGADTLTTAWDDPYEYDNYTIYRAEASGSTTADYTQVASGVAAEEYQHTGLEDGEQYYVRVTAVESSTESTLSAEVAQITTLPAPTLDELDASTLREITVTYTLADDSTDGDVLLERSTDDGTSWTEAATMTDLTATSYTDAGLLDGEEYTYRLTRQTDHAESQSGTTAATTILPAVSGVSTSVTGDDITVSWTRNDNNGQYRLHWSRDDGQTWTQGPDRSGSTTSDTIADLLDGEEYRLAVETFTEHTSVYTGAKPSEI